MNRRNFLGTLIGSVAAAAAVCTFPFRVYSFPKEPVKAYSTYIVGRNAMISPFNEYADYVNFSDFALSPLMPVEYDRLSLTLLERRMHFTNLLAHREVFPKECFQSPILEGAECSVVTS